MSITSLSSSTIYVHTHINTLNSLLLHFVTLVNTCLTKSLPHINLKRVGHAKIISIFFISIDSLGFNLHVIALDSFSFSQNLSLRARWNKQVQRTYADWRDATGYSVLCSKHFTNNCFKEGSVIAAQFGIQKRTRLKPDAVPTIFHRLAATCNGKSKQFARRPICWS